MGQSRLAPTAARFLLVLAAVATLLLAGAGAQYISYKPFQPACPGQCGAPGQSYTNGHCTYVNHCQH